jgi:hypothetical protein
LVANTPSSTRRYPNASAAARRIPQQTCAQTPAAVRWQQSHEEIADMRCHLAGHWRDVAPTNHLSIADGNELRKTFLDVALDEAAHLFDRRRLKARDKLAFPRHRVNGGMEALDVFCPDRANLDRHRLAPNQPRDSDPGSYPANCLGVTPLVELTAGPV